MLESLATVRPLPPAIFYWSSDPKGRLRDHGYFSLSYEACDSHARFFSLRDFRPVLCCVAVSDLAGSIEYSGSCGYSAVLDNTVPRDTRQELHEKYGNGLDSMRIVPRGVCFG